MEKKEEIQTPDIFWSREPITGHKGTKDNPAIVPSYNESRVVGLETHSVRAAPAALRAPSLHGDARGRAALLAARYRGSFGAARLRTFALCCVTHAYATSPPAFPAAAGQAGGRSRGRGLTTVPSLLALPPSCRASFGSGWSRGRCTLCAGSTSSSTRLRAATTEWAALADAAGLSAGGGVSEGSATEAFHMCLPPSTPSTPRSVLLSCAAMPLLAANRT